MDDALTVLAPFDFTEAVELSAEERPDGADADTVYFRKQILPRGSIQYAGRTLEFSQPFFENMVEGFENRAFDEVAFQLADGDNKHTRDPERKRGNIEALEIMPDGLDAIVAVPKQHANLVRGANAKLGVSPRFIEHMGRSDGSKFPVALEHVLGTLDPNIRGMRPWEQVSLAREGEGDVVNLADAVSYEEHRQEPEYREEQDMPGRRRDNGQGDVVTLSREEYDNFQAMQAWVADQQAQAAEVELTQMQQDQAQAVELSGGQVVELTPEAREYIQSVEADAREAREQVSELTNTVSDAQLESEVEQILATGIAPSLVELSLPLLAAPRAVELTSGESVDGPGEIIRQVLWEILELNRQGALAVDLNREEGFGGADTDTEVSMRKAALDAWETEFPA